MALVGLLQHLEGVPDEASRQVSSPLPASSLTAIFVIMAVGQVILTLRHGDNPSLRMYNGDTLSQKIIIIIIFQKKQRIFVSEQENRIMACIYRYRDIIVLNSAHHHPATSSPAAQRNSCVYSTSGTH